MKSKILQLDSRDNVLIALTDLHQGEQIEHEKQRYTLVSDVPAKHKFATEDLDVGANIVMYGVLVGKAVTLLISTRAESSRAQRRLRGWERKCWNSLSRWLAARRERRPS